MTVASGKLVVCATPIGNLGDVTLRVLDALRDADAVLAEDTRVTRTLLARYEIGTPIERYDAHATASRTAALMDRIRAGERLALVSDAGTPGISDPGHTLIEECLAADLTVEVLPGASAVLAALVASGLPTHAFFFGGFLPRKPGSIRARLEELADLDATLVFYESPRRTAATLKLVRDVLPGRQAAMARELTKVHEEVVRGTTEAVLEAVGERELKGEVVLLVGPPARGSAGAVFDAGELREQVERLVSAGSSRSAAVRAVAEATGAPRNAVYRAAIDAGSTTPPASGRRSRK